MAIIKFERRSFEILENKKIIYIMPKQISKLLKFSFAKSAATSFPKFKNFKNECQIYIK